MRSGQQLSWACMHPSGDKQQLRGGRCTATVLVRMHSEVFSTRQEQLSTLAHAPPAARVLLCVLSCTKQYRGDLSGFYRCGVT